ncbi:hypothetical protein LV84_01188 [Algoriphagus ratkowskyi]|uniref:Uncharacterized protein n=1 Tax=Algoriphagus ratkowskyi TaxID=57028 RepID=A0A2W7T7G3_9BACT|nr:hypothetical protein LV84_01188 [Algoriphagus ratkowskyi]
MAFEAQTLSTIRDFVRLIFFYMQGYKIYGRYDLAYIKHPAVKLSYRLTS